MNHSISIMFANEKVADIQQINDRTVHLEFINTDSVDIFIELLDKLIENKNIKI